MSAKTKMIVDTLMLTAMFFAMSFHLMGPGAHKSIGLLTLALFAIHNVLNRRWYKHLRKGKYSPLRIARTVTNFTVMLAMIGVMVSGVMLAKGAPLGRMLHNVFSYVACIGIAVHVGFHLRGRKNHDD